MLAGSLVPAVGLTMPRDTFLPLLALFTLAFLAFELARMRLPRLRAHPFFRLVALKEEEAHGLTGASYLLFASLLVFWLFPVGMAALSLFYLAVGDPAAALVGGRRGRHRIWGKSMEGAGAFFLADMALAAVLLPFLEVKLTAAACGALAAAFIELLPLPLDDNLVIPPGAALAMALLSPVSP